MPNSDPYKYIENCRKMNAKIDEFTVKQMIIFTLKAMSKNKFVHFYFFLFVQGRVFQVRLDRK